MICDVSDLKQLLIEVLRQLQQTVIDKAVDQCMQA